MGVHDNERNALMPIWEGAINLIRKRRFKFESALWNNQTGNALKSNTQRGNEIESHLVAIRAIPGRSERGFQSTTKHEVFFEENK